MSLAFEITYTAASGGRRARLILPHGPVETPVFMPVGTAATVKAVPQSLLEQIGPEATGAQIILANTYHLYLRPGHELIRRLGGVHRFMSWTRPMLTDSGGFQVFSLSPNSAKSPMTASSSAPTSTAAKHFFSPEHSIAVQIALGADIMPWSSTSASKLPRAGIALASFYGPDTRLGRPLPRLLRGSRTATKSPWNPPTLNGQTQSPLRHRAGRHVRRPPPRKSAERLVDMDFPGYAIGGLAVGEPRELTREMIARTLEHLPADKPRYVMGVGYPDEIEEYARMGVDMMDCVLPTRVPARHGLLFTSQEETGRLNIKKKDYAEDQSPIDSDCTCIVCARYSRAYLRHLYASGEPLAATLNSVHNLHFYLAAMQRIRRILE